MDGCLILSLIGLALLPSREAETERGDERVAR
jgi:hypothetical protein